MPEADRVAANFDQRAPDYERGSSWHVAHAARLVELAAPAPGSSIVDAATGTGLAAVRAARVPGVRVLGVDISAGMLALAGEAVAGLDNVELRQADATALPDCPDASVDLVLCSAGLLYLPVPVALREWHRLLVPGGRVAFSTMHADFPVAARVFREHARAYGLVLDDPSAPLGTPQRCGDALRAAGFVPGEHVTEGIRFARTDLEYAWDAHLRGPHADAIAGLSGRQRAALRRDYTAELAERLRADPDGTLTATVIYAFGHKPKHNTGNI